MGDDADKDETGVIVELLGDDRSAGQTRSGSTSNWIKERKGEKIERMIEIEKKGRIKPLEIKHLLKVLTRMNGLVKGQRFIEIRRVTCPQAVSMLNIDAIGQKRMRMNVMRVMMIRIMTH